MRFGYKMVLVSTAIYFFNNIIELPVHLFLVSIVITIPSLIYAVFNDLDNWFDGGRTFIYHPNITFKEDEGKNNDI